MDYDEEIVQDFLVESYEMLDTMDETFVLLEDDPSNPDVLSSVFRVMHTVKGASGFLGFNNLERLCHHAESLLSLLRDGELALTTAMTDALLATVDRIRQILEAIEGGDGDASVEVSDLIEVLAALYGADLDEPADSGDEAAEPVDDLGFGDGLESSQEPESVDDELAEQAEAVDDVVEDTIEEDPDGAVEGAGGEAAVDQNEDDTKAASSDTAAEANSAEDDGAETTSAEASSAEASSAEVNGGKNIGGKKKGRIGDILVEKYGADRTDVEIAAAEQALGDNRPLGVILSDRGEVTPYEVEAAAQAQKKLEKRSASESTIRVDVELLDDLMNLIGELVLTRNEILQYITETSERGLAQSSQRLDLLTSELQDKVMTTRMQSIGGLWNKLPRVVRDLAQQCGKQIRLEMEGKETELDKSLIESIKDPLTHIVRNTVDHGIEKPEDRIAAGKPAEGVLSLSAGHQDGHVIITIADDGGGIDLDRVRSKAVDRELITAEAASTMSDEEAVNLIFLPGFSTAEAVTKVSGRGVGMDVVRTNIEKIGGAVEIHTSRGEGTTFRIEIPLTLAIVPALVVVSGGRRYAIPQRSLVELLSIDNGAIGHSIEFVHDAPVIRLRDRLLPVLQLGEALEDGDPPKLVGDMVVLSSEGAEFGLLVDEIIETQEIVVKPLGQVIHEVDVFSGATILGDGRVALILDVVGLGQQAQVVTGRAVANREADQSPEGGAEVVGKSTALLLLSVGDERQVAMALPDVARLDEFDASAVEHVGHRKVVQYRSEIMPLVDLGMELGYGPARSSENGGPVSVVVYRHNGRDVGLVIDRTLDIIDHQHAERTATGNLVIQGRVTEMVDASRLPSLAVIEREFQNSEVLV